MRLGDGKTVSFYNGIMKILTVISLLSTILNPYIINANGNYANKIQASYEYGIGYVNIYDNSLGNEVSTQFYIDININFDAYYSGTLYINMRQPVYTTIGNTPWGSTFYPHYVVIGAEYITSGYTNAGSTSFGFRFNNVKSFFVRLYYKYGALNYYGLQNASEKNLEWTANGNQYIYISSLNASSITLIEEDDSVDNIESTVNTIDSNIQYFLNIVDTIGLNVGTITSNTSNISSLLNQLMSLTTNELNVISQFDTKLHYFQFRVNDASVDGYPRIVETIENLNAYAYYKELDSYTIKRWDIRTDQEFINGNYLVWTFYFKSNNQFNEQYFNNIWVRVRDNNGYLTDLTDYYVYLTTGRTVDDNKYFAIYTMYIPVYNFVLRTSPDYDYHFNLSMAMRSNDTLLTGIIKVGCIYRGIVDILPNDDPINSEYTVLDKLDTIIGILGNISVDNQDLTNKNTVDNFFNNLLQNLNLPSFPDKDNEPMFPILKEFIGYYGQIVGNQHLSLYRWLLSLSSVFLVLKVILL